MRAHASREMREGRAVLSQANEELRSKRGGTIFAKERNMRNVLLVGLFFATLAGFAQGSLVYDQQSATNGFGTGGSTIQNQQPMGQSFTPASAFVGFAQFQFDDFSGSLGATVYLELLENSISGNVIAASSPVFMANNFFGTATFFFPSNVVVQSEVEYFLRPVLQSGDNTALLSDLYNYSRGAAIFSGVPRTDARDFWFREGYVVPEPSSVLLAFLGGGFFFLRLWRRRITELRSTSTACASRSIARDDLTPFVRAPR